MARLLAWLSLSAPHAEGLRGWAAYFRDFGSLWVRRIGVWVFSPCASEPGHAETLSHARCRNPILEHPLAGPQPPYHSKDRVEASLTCSW